MFQGNSPCFRWFNKKTLWPLRSLEDFFPQITKIFQRTVSKEQTGLERCKVAKFKIIFQKSTDPGHNVQNLIFNIKSQRNKGDF